MAAPNDKGADQGAPDPEVVAFWKYRRRTARGLFGVVACIAVVIVFNRPEAWAIPEVVYMVQYLGWLGVISLSLAAFKWNGEMSEHKGFYRGKHGLAPPDLKKAD